jgi:hypothetical protein
VLTSSKDAEKQQQKRRKFPFCAITTAKPNNIENHPKVSDVQTANRKATVKTQPVKPVEEKTCENFIYFLFFEVVGKLEYMNI